MKISSHKKILYLAILILAGCSPTAPVETTVECPTPYVPQEATYSPSEGLTSFEGHGMSFMYAAGAHLEISEAVEPAIAEVRVIGPSISIRPGDQDWMFDGPAYEIIVRVFENPEGLDAETWARGYFISLWELTEGGPIGAPVTSDGLVNEALVARVTVAGYPAFRGEWFGGDSAILIYYVRNGSEIVAIQFRDYPLPNQPLNPIQHDIYEYFLGTIRLLNE